MLLTIFTPTYNRKKLLSRLYESLLRQTDSDFEWILVDDGSSDGTAEWIDSLPETPFRFKYILSQNKGKHIAINLGVSEALGQWFFIVDSDDYLTQDAVAKLKQLIAKTPETLDFAGFCTNRLYEDGKLNGNPVNYDVLDTDFINYSIKYGYNGEKPACLHTRVWKEFPFPEYEGEKFCSEALVLRRIAKKYKVRYFNESVYIMEGYLEDGLTYSLKKHFYNSPSYASILFKEQLNLPKKSFKFTISTYYNFWYYYNRSVKDENTKPSLNLKVVGYPIFLLVSSLKKLLKQ